MGGARSRGAEGAQTVQAGGKTLRVEMPEPVQSVWNREELPDQWKESIIEIIYRNGHKPEWSNYYTTLLLSISYKVLSDVQGSSLSPYTAEIYGIISVGFDVRGQLLIRFLIIVRYRKKDGSTLQHCIMNS
jgi:hypothetical protein